MSLFEFYFYLQMQNLGVNLRLNRVLVQIVKMLTEQMYFRSLNLHALQTNKLILYRSALKF